MVRIVHYLNQFFGQIGGEEKADVPPRTIEGPIGPGLLLEDLIKDEGKVVATVISGDNYFSENTEEAASALLDMIASYRPDALIAGPAFNAGRYGLSCGELCKRVRERFNIPVITGMYPENPGADLYRKQLYIVKTANNAAGMRKAMPVMVCLLLKILRGEHLEKPSEEGYLPQGIKKNVLSDKLASERAMEMLLKKMRGKPFHSEIAFPDLDSVPPASPIQNLSRARIALVTEGGLVPKGNPDNLQRARATRYARYNIANDGRLDSGQYESIHRGFDTTLINQDPNRLVPLDALREMEKEGKIKEICPEYFVTTGVATTMENGKRIGKGIAKDLLDRGVSGAIVIST